MSGLGMPTEGCVRSAGDTGRGRGPAYRCSASGLSLRTFVAVELRSPPQPRPSAQPRRTLARTRARNATPKRTTPPRWVTELGCGLRPGRTNAIRARQRLPFFNSGAPAVGSVWRSHGRISTEPVPHPRHRSRERVPGGVLRRDGRTSAPPRGRCSGGCITQTVAIGDSIAPSSCGCRPPAPDSPAAPQWSPAMAKIERAAVDVPGPKPHRAKSVAKAPR